MPIIKTQLKVNRPFLKWAGGKTRLVERIKKLLPEGDCLLEPFVGSGAVFLNTDYQRYLLGDINADLINLYLCLQAEGESFIEYVGNWFAEQENSKTAYYHWRDYFNQSSDKRERSALFLYLNRHGYNGLCRYNLSGGFNVPFGRYKKPYFPVDEMFFFAEKSKKATFVCGDFAPLMQRAKPDDVVYCDPPYVPLSSSAYFTNYTKEVFGLDSQQQLAKTAEQLSQTGVTVLISNHDNELTNKIYREAVIHNFPVRRMISCKGNERKKVVELLALYQGNKL